MWSQIKQHPWAVGVAALIHLLLLAFFVVNVEWHHDVGSVQSIQAQMSTDQNKVNAIKEQMKQAPKPAPKPVEPEPVEPERDLEQERLAEIQRQQEAEEKRLRDEAKLEQQREDKQKQAELQLKREQERKKLAEDQRRKEDQRKEEKRKQAELKKKQEQQRIAELAREKKAKAAEAEKKRKAELKRREDEARKKRLAAEKQRKLEQQKEQQEAERQAESERIAAMIAEEETAMAAARVSSLKGQYMGAIKQRVQSRWLQPPDGASGECRVEVIQAPTGGVLDVRVQTSATCNEAMKESVEKAVWRSDPLPRAPDPRVFERQIIFTFDPREA